MAIMIMIPPMVGVPVFFICPSRPRLRMISPTCIFCSLSMILRPNTSAMNSDIRIAATDRKVM